MVRHIAQLRSICETFGGKPAYCTCGKRASDHVHFTSKEVEQGLHKPKPDPATCKHGWRYKGESATGRVWFCEYCGLVQEGPK